ncbi:MAG: Ca-activated chloride channel family protein [Candidatus Endobugula sp.]|jgi:Ca-activated chloride channel family protein
MDELNTFHFIRPLWLLLIPVLLLLTYWLSKQGQQRTGFEHCIDASLLKYITTGNELTANTQRRTVTPMYILLTGAWMMTCIILAGPTWQQLPQPLQKSKQAMVIILDLSPSMRAEDNKPSRIVRARLKIKDLLSQRKDGLTALIVYAGESHIVTPLTDDTKTIDNLLSTLNPGLLPIPGSNIEMAIESAAQLVKDAAISDASYVLLTDGIDPRAVSAIKKTLNAQSQHTLFIIGVGTPAGAPIPQTTSDGQQGFLRDKSGSIINAPRNDDVLQQVASTTNGHYLPLQANDTDINFILSTIEQGITQSTQQAAGNNEQSRTMDQWAEFGPMLLLLCLPFFALMFRRGWLLSVLLIALPMTMPEPAYALSWDDLLLNKDQQAKQAFDNEDYSASGKLFTENDNHQWQGSAAYKNQDYQAAADAFAKGDTATDDYNRGNALSQLQRFDEAITAYDSALEKDPTLEDAQKNKALVKKIKEQQEKQKKQDKGKEGENGDDQQEQKDGEKKEEQGEESQQDSSEKQQGEESQEQEQQKEKPSEEQNKEQNEEQASAQKDAAQEDKESHENGEPTDPLSAFDQLSTEEQQELEQWLQKIPDDPSGLLRRKFKYEFEKRRQLYQSGKWDLPDNNAHERY